jgi:phosphatidylinositol glycan class H protein
LNLAIFPVKNYQGHSHIAYYQQELFLSISYQKHVSLQTSSKHNTTLKMLATAPHLQVRRPSPTAIEYTVSTTPPLTLSLRALLTASFMIRILLGLSTLLLLHSRWQLSSYSTPLMHPVQSPEFLSSDMIWHLISIFHYSTIGLAFTKLAASAPLPILLPTAAFILFAIIQRIHTSESLLVLRGLGIQTSTSGSTYLASASTRFIPTEKIQDILVNEAFRGFEVRYYLVVIVEGEEEVVVVFPKLLPARKIVEKVWRGAKGCLYEPEKGKDNN